MVSTLFPFIPRLTERDEGPSSEGGLDPLGLAAIADRLATKLVPGVRERQRHPRFLTAIAVSLKICESFGPDAFCEKDGLSEPWQIFEWHFVEGMGRTSRQNTDDFTDFEDTRKRPTTSQAEGTRGIPGSLKAWQAWNENQPLSAKRYLKSPSVFGFHGVYRVLARALEIEDATSGRVGPAGEELLEIWKDEQQLHGFGTASAGEGTKIFQQLRKAIEEGLRTGTTIRSKDSVVWKFFREHLDLYKLNATSREAKFLVSKLAEQTDGHRGDVLNFLISRQGTKAWKQHWSEREFHDELKKQAGSEMKSLLETIQRFEEFSRLCQNAFDACLREMGAKNGPKATSKSLGEQDAVRSAFNKSSELFQELLGRLEPFGQAFVFQNTCERLGTTAATSAEWVDLLLKHHIETQKRKPPQGKNPWFFQMTGGHWQLRTRYAQRDWSVGRDSDSYVHAYRTNSLWNFALDLKAVTE